MIQVKICGITNKNEIEYINELKPEYIGFVFTKSKRQINGKMAKELCFALNKEVKRVGVFKDNSIEEILNIIEEVRLDAIQLHGKEDINFISMLKSNINNSIKIWKALSVNEIQNIRLYKSNGENELIDNLLIDGDNPGSGEVFSLKNIRELLKKNYMSDTTEGCKFFLAGGITPENVIERVEKADPIGVDVSSGVEIIYENGVRIKSFEKMKSLIDNVRKIK